MAFFKRGGSTLFPEELELLRLDGEIAGLQLLHLQCNAGQDSLSLAAETRAQVTGVDLSDDAIAFAKALATESGIAASFQQGEAIAWLESTSLRFDIVFASYGALPWIEDLRRYMRGVARVLVPGGRAVFLEFHPLVWSFSEDWRADRDPYFSQGRAFIEPVRDYVGQSGAALAPSGYVEVNEPYVNLYEAHSYQHTVADIVQAMVDAPLTMTTMREWPVRERLQDARRHGRYRREPLRNPAARLAAVDARHRRACALKDQQEILPRVSIDVSYNRRSWGNHFYTDNRAIGPQDFDTATITAPLNPNLPDGGGYPVTFVTRNALSPLGATDNYYTFASDYGDVTTFWHGAELSINARTRSGITFQGGTGTGRGVRDFCEVTDKLPEIFVTPASVLANQQVAACAVTEPWLTSFRGAVTYTIPKIDVLVSSSFRSTGNVITIDGQYLRGNQRRVGVGQRERDERHSADVQPRS